MKKQDLWTKCQSMMFLAVLAVPITFSLSTSVRAAAVLTFVKAFPVNDGEGVAFDPASGNVVLTNGTFLEFWDVTTETLQSAVPVADAGGILALLETLPNGNFLVRDRAGGVTTRIFEVDDTGATVVGGIDFLSPQTDPRGIAIVNDNRFFIGDQDTDQITEVDAAGATLGLPFGNAAIGDIEGLALSPFGNSLFVADDTNSDLNKPPQLVEFDLEGNFLGTIDLAALGLTGFIDPEGIAADPATGRLFVSNDGTIPQLAVFQVTPEFSTFFWQGGPGLWADDHWNEDGTLANQLPGVNADMVIDLADSVVTVAEDFSSLENGPAGSITLGSNAQLVVGATKTLEATRAIDVGPDATLTVNGTLVGGTTTVDGMLAGSGTISTTDAIEVAGTVDPSGVLTFGGGEMALAGSFDVQVNGEVGQTAGDQILISDGTLELGGTLKITAAGRTTFSNFEAEAMRRVVDNPGTGAIGADVDVGEAFDTVEPAISEHVGQGSFLQAVEYTKQPGFDNIVGVDVELFIAKGGDTDGDGKVWLQDWLNFRPNFDSTGSEGLDWTDGDFDGDGRVWLSDWLIFRPGFSGTPYYVFPTEAEAVPEPGTPAMLLAGLIGLAVIGWRCRQA